MDSTSSRQAQALCDQYGLALERALAARTAGESRDLAQLQSVRNAVLAGISHDYRTPLATILGAASSLADQAERLGAGQRERLARAIVDETNHLSRLTENMLQLARLYAPGMRLITDWQSAEEMIGATLARIRRHDPERRVSARLEPELPLVRCDPLLLSQVLENLVDNALKYSESPAPVEIDVRRHTGNFVFAVLDRGCGVPAESRTLIFEAFQRGIPPTDKEESTAAGRSARSGAGVGLAVCRAIAKAHGGQLRHEARPGGGSSFEFMLPDAEPTPLAQEAAGASQP
jgi:two-component system sensor histidine kinase KdpD